ncbi:IclR family transcriptional regulator [Streptomyces griseocarneus]|nr:IclR family transcriptional regulator [Streptomyces griseocarneus]
MPTHTLPDRRGHTRPRPSSPKSTSTATAAANPPSGAGGTGHAVRVFRVQQAFAELGGEAHSLRELAGVSGLDDSAVHRILQSGVGHGTFTQVGRGLYRLGSSAARLGIHALLHAPNVDAGEVLERLRHDTDGGMVFLYSLHSLTHFCGAQRQCTDMAVGESDLAEFGLTPRELMTLGRSLRLGASGRVILAHLPGPLQERALAEPVPERPGPGVYLDDDQLLATLPEIRERGYAVGIEECLHGWNSCAAPVFWGGSVMGSVVFLKPTDAMPAPSATDVAAVKAAGAGISRLLDGSAPLAVPHRGTA